MTSEEIQYVYQRPRKQFGRQYEFQDKSELIFTEVSNKDAGKDYILRNPVTQATQCGCQMALSEVNTERATYKHSGLFHTEGGWPKDISIADPEQTVRYKRKIEKDENYINQVMGLTKPMEHNITQNNAVNIYENYFENLEPAPLVEHCKSRTINVFRDPNPIKVPITHLSWSPDGGIKIAVSHCDMTFQGDKLGQANNSYIWEIENPNQPFITLEPKVACVCLEYNQKDPTSLVSGMYSGQVAAWDTRHGKHPVMISEREVCHRDPVNSVLWINSKSGTEFFSGGSDGQVLWWDTRKLNEPLDKLYMDPVKTDDQDLSRSYGVSVLEYETTIPTRFMAGTEMGMLFSCNRKSKTPMEKISIRMNCHLGPVYSITRNPAFVKNFLTVGDWTARIWSEDCRESSIIWTKSQEAMLTDGAWSFTKVSLFFITRMDGVLDAWDILQQQNEPVLSIKVCDDPLLCLRTHEFGKLVCCGSKNGATFLIEVSDNMSFSSKNDKPLLTAMFERENKREKILEAKLREIKLKGQRTGQNQAGQAAAFDGGKVSVTQHESSCEQSEAEYYAAIEKERLRRAPGGKVDDESTDDVENEGVFLRTELIRLTVEMNRDQYVYTRERRQFGRQCLFSDRNELIFSEESHPKYMQQYILRNPVDSGTQLSKVMAWSEVTTENVQSVSRGMCHTEGGWPKDLNHNDEEQSLKYRKRIEREESWGPKILHLAQPALAATSQNTAVQIYQNYFELVENSSSREEFGVQTTNVYRITSDTTAIAKGSQSLCGPVSQISWPANDMKKMVVGHAHRNFDQEKLFSEKCFIWDIENPNSPQKALALWDEVTSLEWNCKDEHLIGLGLASGLVGVWDQRAADKETLFSKKEVSQRERISTFHWVHSKTNSEFFTSSTDGTIYWWDARSLPKPIASVFLDPERTDNQVRCRSHSCSASEYEYTIPTRFMVGTEQGYLFLGNRKGLSPSEVIIGNFRVMAGPIFSLQRNPVYTKNFLVVGDWCAKIWTDDCRDSPLYKTPNSNTRYLYGCWSPTRCSLFFLGGEDGILELHDPILSKTPILSISISKSPICALAPHDQGKLLAVGTRKGDVVMVKLSENLTYSTKNERSILATTFERETKRVKLLESRIREIKLKQSNKDGGTAEPKDAKMQSEGAEAISIATNITDNTNLKLEDIEDSFRKVTSKELLDRKQRKFPEINTVFDMVQAHPPKTDG